MMYFPKHNLAVLAVPRTGSTSLEAAFEGSYEPTDFIYQGAEHVREKYGPDTIICAVVRHPLDWLQSWYSQLSSGVIEGWDTTHISFTRFVEKYISGQFLWPTPYQTQTDQLFDGHRLVDVLVPFPKIGQFAKSLAVIIPMRRCLPHLNGSRGRCFTLDTKTMEALEPAIANDTQTYKQAGFPASVAWPPVPV